MKHEIVSIVIRTLREMNGQQSLKIPETLSDETPLFGRSGIMDSLALVSLIVSVEQAIEEELGKTVLLADERAMSQKNSPYRTIGSLADYASTLIPDGQLHG